MAVFSSQKLSGATGYAGLRSSTIQEYRTTAGRLCEAIEKRALRISDLDGATMERLRHHVLGEVHAVDQQSPPPA